MKKKYQILKFYHYTAIKDPQQTRENHYAFGVAHNLLGRIKIASEGINGTISGLQKDCEAYIAFLKADSRFANMMINMAPIGSHVHQKLHVRVRNEIVHAGLPNIIPSPDIKNRAYVQPAEFRKMLDDPNVVVIDVRSKHEYQLGTFENAITFDIANFRELPEQLQNNQLPKDKKYVLVCTYGIRCEKARDYLKKSQQLPHLYHLQGGIVHYGQSTDGKGFAGVCYVFDERLTLLINQQTTAVSQCYHCQKSSYRMINCANPECNMHMPLCEPCGKKLAGACTLQCQQHPRKRPYDGSGYYGKPGILPTASNEKA
ncbi:MAG: rhodanese-related sulfurtransferase [Bacteroidota bacterium]